MHRATPRGALEPFWKHFWYAAGTWNHSGTVRPANSDLAGSWLARGGRGVRGAELRTTSYRAGSRPARGVRGAGNPTAHYRTGSRSAGGVRGVERPTTNYREECPGLTREVILISASFFRDETIAVSQAPPQSANVLTSQCHASSSQINLSAPTPICATGTGGAGWNAKHA